MRGRGAISNHVVTFADSVEHLRDWDVEPRLQPFVAITLPSARGRRRSAGSGPFRQLSVTVIDVVGGALQLLKVARGRHVDR